MQAGCNYCGGNAVTVTYSEILQTISTASGLVTGITGAGCAVYATFIAHRLHGTMTDIHETLKQQRKD